MLTHLSRQDGTSLALERQMPDAKRSVILVHGFTSDRHERGGRYDQLAAALSARGLDAVQFDLPGCSPNEDTTQLTYGSAANDVRLVKEYLLSHGVKRLGLVAYGTSADLALRDICSQPRHGVDVLVLWDSLLDVYGFIAGAYGEAVFEIAERDGSYCLDKGQHPRTFTREFFREVTDRRDQAVRVQTPLTALFIHSPVDRMSPVASVYDTAEALRSCGCEVQIKEARFRAEDRSQRDDEGTSDDAVLCQSTVEFLAEHL